ncbi:MAG TPA: HAD hydrolase-like protein [Bradyrhizobium sp.]|nr:HAD hydrolase-like protein [Bradyrhizobium sp.]
MTSRFHTLITDLDNTLYSWYEFFIPALYGMIDEAAKILHCSNEDLINSLRDVHIHFDDVEQPFALVESTIVKRTLFDQTRAERLQTLDPAFRVFNRIRKQKLTLFPGVAETLAHLHESGVRIIGHTDSKSLAAIGRLDRLNISSSFDTVYCRSQNLSPQIDPERKLYWDNVFAKISVHELPSHKKKPHPEVLIDILQFEGIKRNECVYVGDSKSRDILMAKKAGVFSVWAKYGIWKDQDFYQKLIAVSHWTKNEIVEEVAYAEEAKTITPDMILSHGFEEILPLFGLSEKSFAAVLTGR